MASRPAPFQERATCRASLAADCLLMLSGPWSARSLRERRPRQSLTGRRTVGLALGKAPHLLFFCPQRPAGWDFYLVAADSFPGFSCCHGCFRACSGSFMFRGKANLKSRGTLNPLAFSHSRSFNSLSVLLMSQCRSRLEPTSPIPYEGHPYGERSSIRGTHEVHSNISLQHSRVPFYTRSLAAGLSSRSG